jgi:hypothetical protein
MAPRLGNKFTGLDRKNKEVTAELSKTGVPNILWRENHTDSWHHLPKRAHLRKEWACEKRSKK